METVTFTRKPKAYCSILSYGMNETRVSYSHMRLQLFFPHEVPSPFSRSQLPCVEAASYPCLGFEQLTAHYDVLNWTMNPSIRFKSNE